MITDGADVRRKLVIVTGSSGLIGAAVVRRLAEQFFVIALDREAPRELPPPDCRHIYFDITSDENVRDDLTVIRDHHGEQIAAVIQLVAYCEFFGEPSPKHEAVTVRGIERLLRGLQHFTVEQFLFSPTMFVHAPCEPGQWINEAWPIAPTIDVLADKLRPPRIVLFYVPAGAPTEETCRALRPDLAAGDSVVDGGHSHRLDSRRRQTVFAQASNRFLDVGTSGGVSGARHGARFTVGGERDARRQNPDAGSLSTYVEDTGVVNWALELGVPAPTISAAQIVLMRDQDVDSPTASCATSTAATRSTAWSIRG